MVSNKKWMTAMLRTLTAAGVSAFAKLKTGNRVTLRSTDGTETYDITVHSVSYVHDTVVLATRNGAHFYENDGWLIVGTDESQEDIT